MTTIDASAILKGLRPGRPSRLSLRALVIAGLAIAYGQEVSAQSDFSVVRDCRQAMNDEDRDAAKRYAEIMLEWDGVVSNLQSAAEDCVSYAFGADYRYSPAEGAFVTTDEMEDSQARRKMRAAREALRTANEALEEEYDRRNRALVATSVHDSCLALAGSDPVAAFTNEICVEAFMANGHPDREPIDDFAAGHVSAVVQDMEPREKDDIARLSSDQVELMCESAPATSCMIVREIRNASE